MSQQPVIAQRVVSASATIAVLTAVLVSAACSSSPKPPPSQYQVVSARRQQVIPLLVQCFADKHVLTAGELDDVQASPPIQSSAWLRHGRVTRNQAFGNWYSDTGAGLNALGKTVDTWVTDVAYDPASWPASTCGPRPASIAAQPSYQPPGA